MGFGTEMLFIVALGVVVLGPKQLHAMIGHVVRAKARFEEVTEAFKSQIGEDLDHEHPRQTESPAGIE